MNAIPPMAENYASQNAKAWDEIAKIRHLRTKPASHYASGQTTLNQRLIDAAGELNGKSLLQCQCSTGEETLSWAVLGARATGLDISPRQIDLARQKAHEAELEVRFCVGDVCDLPDELADGSFDLVHTGGGSLMWVPDIEAWARNISAALTVGGRLLLLDEHPVAGCLFVDDGKLLIEDDYFGRKQPIVGSGWRHFTGGEDAKETKYQFSWPLGDVITALASSGLRIDHLSEFPSTARWRFGDDLDRFASLPGTYLLTATKAA